MEFEFDKEIDAILRKTRPAFGKPAAGEHLDADAIAAFAENAVPAASRPIFVTHLADCDRCRTILSQTAVAEPEVRVRAAAAAPLIADAARAKVPWYSSLLRGPGLAFGMGAVLLLLMGGLVYLVTRHRSDQNTAISQAVEPAEKRGGPYDSGAAISESSTANSSTLYTANSAANVPVPAATAANSASSNAMSANMSAKAAPNVDTLKEVQSRDDAKRPNDLKIDGLDATRQPVPSAAAPPPPPVQQAQKMAEAAPKTMKKAEPENRVATGSLEDRSQTTLSSRQMTELPRDRRSSTLLERSAGSNGPVSRSVAGHTFTQKGGVWYDSNYQGQPTVNIGRASKDLKDLDAGLRSIANTLNGVVVVVWKSKAYRIQ